MRMQYVCVCVHVCVCQLCNVLCILTQVSCVINYDVPVYMKTYIHRVGRTARAGEHGTAYTILRPQEVTCLCKKEHIFLLPCFG